MLTREEKDLLNEFTTIVNACVDDTNKDVRKLYASIDWDISLDTRNFETTTDNFVLSVYDHNGSIIRGDVIKPSLVKLLDRLGVIVRDERTFEDEGDGGEKIVYRFNAFLNKVYRIIEDELEQSLPQNTVVFNKLL